jgi:hypothetical protein
LESYFVVAELFCCYWRVVLLLLESCFVVIEELFFCYWRVILLLFPSTLNSHKLQRFHEKKTLF